VTAAPVEVVKQRSRPRAGEVVFARIVSPQHISKDGRASRQCHRSFAGD
jgi:hypothetical protein